MSQRGPRAKGPQVPIRLLMALVLVLVRVVWRAWF
jgi:hypothetical protein